MRPPDWQSDDGAIQLYCGDCLELLPEMEPGSVDAVVTDPPYGLGVEYISFDDTLENVESLARRWLPEVRRISASVVFTPGMGRERLYPCPDHTACWLMAAGGYTASWGFGMWQPILCYGKDRYIASGRGRRPDVVRTNGTDHIKPSHPCPKPLHVWTRVVGRFSVEADTILDPFLGSGTTAVACVKLGRKCIGIEIEPKYFEIAVKRVKAAIVQGPDDALFTQVDKPVQLPLSGTETS